MPLLREQGATNALSYMLIASSNVQTQEVRLGVTTDAPCFITTVGDSALPKH